MIIHPRDHGAGGVLPLATKRGRLIVNGQRLERPRAALDAGVRLWLGQRPEAELRSLTSTYNCIAMVFACRRTWVDPDQVAIILEDDGFKRLASVADARVGDVVLYTDAQADLAHAGIVISNTPVVKHARWDTMVLSKWGLDGEYVHPVDHVPQLLGRPTEYWTERQP